MNRLHFFFLIIIHIQCSSLNGADDRIIFYMESKLCEFDKWKQDTVACLLYRSAIIRNRDIEFDTLMGIDKDKFLRYAGSPNVIMHNKGKDVLIYYISCIKKPWVKNIGDSSSYKMHSSFYIEDSDRTKIYFYFDSKSVLYKYDIKIP